MLARTTKFKVAMKLLGLPDLGRRAWFELPVNE